MVGDPDCKIQLLRDAGVVPADWEIQHQRRNLAEILIEEFNFYDGVGRHRLVANVTCVARSGRDGLLLEVAFDFVEVSMNGERKNIGGEILLVKPEESVWDDEMRRAFVKGVRRCDLLKKARPVGVRW